MKGVFLSIDYRSQIQACSRIAACHWPERLHSEVDSIPSCTARRAERKAIRQVSKFIFEILFIFKRYIVTLQ